MRKYLLLLPLAMLLTANTKANNDSIVSAKIIQYNLNNSDAYKHLEYLCKSIGNRLSGTSNAEKAVQWSYQLMQKYGFDSVYLQACIVPKWVRGNREKAYIEIGKKQVPLQILALGKSTATPQQGLNLSVIQVNSMDELNQLKEIDCKNKIIFMNQAFNDSFINCFDAYAQASPARRLAPLIASQKGASAIVIRSLTFALDTFAHTGNMGSLKSVMPIPSFALSTTSADALVTALSNNKNVQLYIKNTSYMEVIEVPSHNVIGVIKGAEKSNEIITVGAHLDSWDVGEGAHDDGAGLMHCIQAAKTLMELGIKPKHTIHIVFFMNEENGLRGANAYAQSFEKNDMQKCIVAIESDAGGFAPTGFGFDGASKAQQILKENKKYFNTIGVYNLDSKGSGADIGPLGQKFKTPLVGLKVADQEYFNYHHTHNDTFDKVNKRELQLGTAAMAMFIFFIDKYY